MFNVFVNLACWHIWWTVNSTIGLSLLLGSISCWFTSLRVLVTEFSQSNSLCHGNGQGDKNLKKNRLVYIELTLNFDLIVAASVRY